LFEGNFKKLFLIKLKIKGNPGTTINAICRDEKFCELFYVTFSSSQENKKEETVKEWQQRNSLLYIKSFMT